MKTTRYISIIVLYTRCNWWMNEFMIFIWLYFVVRIYISNLIKVQQIYRVICCMIILVIKSIFIVRVIVIIVGCSVYICV